MTNNKLFILLTDDCNLDCDFCFYKQKESKNTKSSCIDSSCDSFIREKNKIDLNIGYAKQSIKSLSSNSEIIGFSGGGEPLLNINSMLEIIKLTSNKRYIITTNGSIHESQLKKMINKINEASKLSNSNSVLRISLDTFHLKSSKYNNTELLIQWFLDDTWEHCNHLFFRSLLIEENVIKNELISICDKNNWNYEWIEENKLTRSIKINNKEFKIILRPLVNPHEIGIEDTYNIFEYSDILSKTDGFNLILGIPKGCQGCHGCKGLGVPVCGSDSGLDITIATDGNVYLYGAEISSLGSIYDEHITYNLLKKRINKSKIYTILRNNETEKILKYLSKDIEFKKYIEEINYPYWVIKILNKKNPEKLKTMLLEFAK